MRHIATTDVVETHGWKEGWKGWQRAAAVSAGEDDFEFLAWECGTCVTHQKYAWPFLAGAVLADADHRRLLACRSDWVRKHGGARDGETKEGAETAETCKD